MNSFANEAEKIIEDVVNKLHPTQSKAVLPATEAEVLEKFAKFLKATKPDIVKVYKNYKEGKK